MRNVAVLLCVCGFLLLMSGCDSSTPGLLNPEPWTKPKYPPHEEVRPSVSPSKFQSGTPFDWENPMPKPWTFPNQDQYTFANTRSFDETAAWIKKTLEKQLKPFDPVSNPERISDIHFRGCIFEWHEEQLFGPTHINEYNYSVNLTQAELTQIMPNTESIRLSWDMKQNPVLFRAWEKEEGGWKFLGERLQDGAAKTFSVPGRDVWEYPLAFAFRHAARLCGAKPPVYR